MIIDSLAHVAEWLDYTTQVEPSRGTLAGLVAIGVKDPACPVAYLDDLVRSVEFGLIDHCRASGFRDDWCAIWAAVARALVGVATPDELAERMRRLSPGQLTLVDQALDLADAHAGPEVIGRFLAGVCSPLATC